MANPPIPLPGGWPKVTASDYNRLLPYLVWPSVSTATPAGPIRGQARLRDDNNFAFELYYGATTGWQPPWNLPWGGISKAEVFSNQGAITTIVDLTSLTITWTALANRTYEVYGEIHSQSTNTADVGILSITDGSSVKIQQAQVLYPIANTNVKQIVSKRVTPSAGSVTVKLRLERVGAGTLTMGAGANFPAYIAVTDQGPAGTAPAS